ncbi:hypothetical protein BCD48_38200 [Pseudofrankia sp. BMG5.36]|nr:hypothetical protein BCD48_38200 [Pseudofrankia sp. BMG5.36]
MWFNSHNDMPRQFDLTLAALQPEDSEGTTWRKARLVANFIDLFVVTRGLRDLPYNRDEVHELVAALLPAVRESRTEDDLSGVLGRAAADWYPHFSHVREARYREGSNRAFVLYFLARLTAWLERGVGGGEQAQRLLTAQADRRRFEVEHLFTKKLGVYPDQATPDEEIQLKRGMLGGLVLINGADNASLGGLRLEDKLLPYQRSNSLAASLHPNAVKGRGTRVFRQFVAQHNLTDKFQPYQPGEPIGPFIESRGRLYQAIAELVWSPEELGLTMPASREPSGHTKNGASIGVYKARTRHTTTLADIAREGMIRPDERLIGRRNGLAHRATWLQDGRIRIESGEIFTTPTPAANRATGNEVGSGWTFWTVERTKATLAAVRSQYLQAVSGTANGP